MKKTVYLSPTALNLFKECPRCFWLDKIKKVRRPRGIFPSLPGGMDLVIKTYFDKYRQDKGLPPELKGKVAGGLFPDLAVLEVWRSWRKTNLCYTDKEVNVCLSGALDDCLVDGDYYIPLDYKTRGFVLKEDPAKYYQTQLDCYCLMLEALNYKTKGIAYLVYYWPEEVKEAGMVKFKVTPYKIDTDIDRAKGLIKQAARLLEQEDIPDAGPECEYCSYFTQKKNTELS